MDPASYTNDVGAPGWLSPVEQATLDLGVVSLSPMLGVEFTLKKVYTHK